MSRTVKKPIRRRSGKKTLHVLLLSVFFLGAGLVLSLTVFFKIETVSVIGSDKYDPLELAEASGVAVGENLFRISPGAISAALLDKYPYIESVEVVRKIPSAVEIHVTQCVPGGAVRENEDFVLITKDGKVLERGAIFIPEDIALIKGLDTSGVMPGRYLGAEEKLPRAPDETSEQQELREQGDTENADHANKVKSSLQTLDYLYKAMDESGFAEITNMDITDPLNIKIMYENRLVLELGSEAELPFKLEFVKTVINKLEPGARGMISAGNAKVNVVFTPEEGYEAAPAPEESTDGDGNNGELPAESTEYPEEEGAET